MRLQRVALMLTTFVSAIAVATAALAQPPDPHGPLPSQPQIQPMMKKVTVIAPAPEGVGTVEVTTEMAGILERGAREPATTRTEAETKIHEAMNDVNDVAVREGNDKLAERLAGEFATTPEVLTAEKESTGMSWAELMLARMLLASGIPDVSLDQVHQMKKDGNGWGLIAAGMGYRLKEVVSAVRAEAKVAAGVAKADGKLHPIRVLDVDGKTAINGATKTGGGSGERTPKAKPTITDALEKDTATRR